VLYVDIQLATCAYLQLLMLVSAGSWDDCLTKEGTVPYIPHVTTRTADKVHRLLYF